MGEHNLIEEREYVLSVVENIFGRRPVAKFSKTTDELTCLLSLNFSLENLDEAIHDNPRIWMIFE